MDHHTLTVGAHLLLWGFPLALIILVVVSSVRDARQNGESS